MNKYELLKTDTKEINGIKLYRIKYLKDFADIKAGDLGGYIEKENNLSQYGDALVCGNALVYGNALVSGDAWVSGNAKVSGNAQVSDNAWVYGNAQISDNAWVYGDARIYDNYKSEADEHSPEPESLKDALENTILPMTENKTKASKNDIGKPDFSLIPKVAMEAEARAFMVGEKKYGRYNYYKGHKASQLIAALIRHAQAWNEGEECDPVDGQPHLGSVRACAAMLLKQVELGTLQDDRYKKENEDADSKK